MKLASLFTAQPWGNGNDVVFILNFPYHWNIPYLFRYLSGTLMHIVNFINFAGEFVSKSFTTLEEANKLILLLTKLNLTVDHYFEE